MLNPQQYWNRLAHRDRMLYNTYCQGQLKHWRERSCQICHWEEGLCVTLESTSYLLESNAYTFCNSPFWRKLSATANSQVGEKKRMQTEESNNNPCIGTEKRIRLNM